MTDQSTLRVTVYLPLQAAREGKAIAARRGITFSGFVAEILDAALPPPRNEDQRAA